MSTYLQLAVVSFHLLNRSVSHVVNLDQVVSAVSHINKYIYIYIPLWTAEPSDVTALRLNTLSKAVFLF